MLPALRRALGLVLLVPVVALAGPGRALDLDDVLRLHSAGVSDDIVISEIVVTESVFHLGVDDILRFKEAGMSERLIQFLIDTGRDVDAVDEELTADGTAYDDGTVSDTPYYDEWVNEIEVEPARTTTYVSLNYDYSRWWYDCYWYDYWYWDFNYYPYSSSWVVSLGGWYPGWYGYRYCWAPAYWGYRSWCYDRWDYPWWAGTRYCSANDRYYYAGYRYGTDGYARRDGLSQTKTKSGSLSGGGGLPVYVDAGLKVPDGGRLDVRDAKVPVDLRGKSRDGRLAVSDRPGRSDGKTPVRTPTDTVKLPEGGSRKPVVPDRTALGAPDTDRNPVRPTPVRDVRAPADGGRPVKVRTLSDPSGEVADTPGRGDSPTPSRGDSPTPTKPTPDAQSPAEPPSRGGSSPPSTVKPPATPAPKSPTVAPSPPRTVKPAPAPTPKASPPPRSSPPPQSTAPPARSKGSPAPSKPKGRR